MGMIFETASYLSNTTSYILLVVVVVCSARLLHCHFLFLKYFYNKQQGSQLNNANIYVVIDHY